MSAYKILTAPDAASLAREVNAAKADGWRTQGGIAVTVRGTHIELWAQAMEHDGEPAPAKKRAPKLKELSQEEIHALEEKGRKQLETEP